MAAEREPVGVIGTGYVGLVSAAGFAELGSEVWCVDIDAEKIERLRRGEVPIYEPGLEELLAKHAGRLHFSTELAPALEHARLLFVAVGTPPTHSGDADLAAVNAVVEEMPNSDRHALVMKSTVPCGTGATIQRVFRERGKEAMTYVSCPEFLKEGSAVKDFMHPDRVVVGDEGNWAGEAVVGLYRPLLSSAHGGRGPGELVRTDVASAEMIKLAANAFLATKISFINEIANICEETGADVIEVARGVGLDNRIGPRFLQAGIGYGGSCFTKDVSALKLLAANSGYHFQLLNAVTEVNELQKRRVVSKLERHLGGLAGKRVAMLGLAFKPETDDMRGASSLVLAARLLAEGAVVSAYDPIAEHEARALMPQLTYRNSAVETLEGADAVILVTEWPQCVDLDWGEVAAAMRGRVVIDGRNALDSAAVRAAGLLYEGIGRGAPDRPQARPGGRRREDNAP
jgi:UDPglucose 6-dehydrogenase